MKNLLKKIRKAFKMPPYKVASYVYLYSKSAARKAFFSSGLKNLVSKKPLGYYFPNFKNSFDKHFIDRTSPIGDFYFEYLQKNITENDARILMDDADKICEHIFDLLGSGERKLGKDINWHQDFKSGRVWLLKWSTSLSFGEGDGTDIKMPWELSRFYHAPILAKSFIVSKDKKYAAEFMAQVLDWQKNNPIYFGPNWMNAMEAAIRIANLILAYEIFKSAEKKFGVKVFDETFTKNFLKLIIVHGEYIFDNLENKGTKSNHYLSDLLGLVYIGAIYPEIKNSSAWLEFASKEIKKEIQSQVYEDGVDYESSISYHRLVVELFGHAVLVFQIYNLEIADILLQRIQRMFNFTRVYTKPNGLAPLIGDNDDGRLHFIFDKNFYNWEPRDHSHLFEIESALPLPRKREASLISAAFEKAQIFIMRTLKTYAIVDCGNVGQGGNGGHAHNDVFSFEYNFAGKDFIVDPGTYSYTAFPEERNVFRSTKMHNTVYVDEEEQNRFSKELLFQMKEDAQPVVLKWSSLTGEDILMGEHHGYERLAHYLTHRRSFVLDKDNDIFTIEDSFRGVGEHKLNWNFHLDSAVGVSFLGSKSEGGKNIFRYSLKNGDVGVYLDFYFPNSITIKTEIEDSWLSLKYGVKMASKNLSFEYFGEIPENGFVVKIYPTKEQQ